MMSTRPIVAEREDRAISGSSGGPGPAGEDGREAAQLLFKGELKTKLSLDIERASKNATAAIEKLGGKVTVKVKQAKREKVKKDPKTGKAIKA